ncbi:ATP-dependent RNA helicase DDX24 [Atta colombica]|uniref:ATP-dependent RNA helicase n=1 Tax=Atta colombica TaxID=520822 RepID=A0A195BT89_9HYME|nr:PREDICTED: ATP-dependent RNA helicase DDX24 [Atta colombica]XP_018059500.1 PREDICTED: ATP-dependent RNA helicase DDX24 [Atta colombica]XP_018059501.1 PREDICTED: ATP-dependent RNA helicase DDX24 [Atta colombica]KYM89644.1 ATP-dependent RNA helicase DDX24 [Atta colombica]
MTKSKRVSNNGWKPVTLEDALLSNDIEGLIEIEELTDYNLERSSKKGKIITTRVKSIEEKKSASKRKCSKEREDTDINIEPSTKKSKIKKAVIKDLKIKNEKIKPANFKITDQRTNSDSDSYCDIDSNKNLAKINAEAWRSMGVPTAVIKALADQNFHSPTMIQTRTLPAAILGCRDILGAAETGSGKTLAFGIPIIKGILDLKNQNKDQNSPEKDTEESDSENIVLSEFENCVNIVNDKKLNDCHNISTQPLYALILTPTRELAIQIKNHLTQAVKYTDVKIAVVLGGMAAVKQERILNKGPEIVIATPGRLWELIQEGNSHLSQIDSIRYLAIDETDRMMERGHFQELHNLLEKMNANPAKMQKRQTFVFSATLTMVHDLPDYLDRKKKRYARSKICKLTSNQKLQKIIQLLKIKNPKVVDLTKESGIVDNLTECRIACTIDHKDYYLYYFLKRHNGRTLVFCNSIGCVKRLATLFNILECKPLLLHANMQQRQRLKNLERFQDDKNGLLIATDVAARGLDIPNIEHVIHYQVPRTAENYVHRSGRTARAQKEGITVLMMEPSEKQNYIKLCKTLGRTHDLPIFPVVDRILVTIKERVDVARDIDKIELKCRRQNNQKNWLQKAMEDMEMILDEEDNDESSTESEEAAVLRRQLKAKQNQLRSLLSKPVFPKGFSGKYLDANLNIDVAQNAQKAIEVMKKIIENNTDKSKDNNATSQKRQHTQKLRCKKLKKT